MFTAKATSKKSIKRQYWLRPITTPSKPKIGHIIAFTSHSSRFVMTTEQSIELVRRISSYLQAEQSKPVQRYVGRGFKKRTETE